MFNSSYLLALAPPNEGSHREVEPAGSHLCEIVLLSGVPGVSIGVLHHGDVVFCYNYGYRDMELHEPVTTHTIYPIASLSKAITALVYGSLVSDGILDWHSPIHNILPEFCSTAQEVE